MIEGATSSSFTALTGDAGTHSYHVAVPYTKGSVATMVSSSSVTVEVKAPGPPIDTGALDSAIASAETLNEPDCTHASWAVYSDALASAKQVRISHHVDSGRYRSRSVDECTTGACQTT